MKDITKYNIIHIRDYYPSKENPASSPWVYDIVDSTQKKGYSTLVISPTPFIPKFLRKIEKFSLYPIPSDIIENINNTHVIRPKYIKIPKNKFIGLNFFLLSRLISKIALKYSSPKLIHAHFGQNGIAAVSLKRKLNIPLITSFYGYDSGRLGQTFAPYYKKLIEFGDLFLALSEDMKLDLIKLGFPEKKIRIHHLGIKTEQFFPIKYSKEEFVFLVVARLDESKGVQDVIHAFNMIANESMTLRIVGAGKYRNKLIEVVKELDISDKVIFIDNFKAVNPRGVVVREMQRCDVALLTSFIDKNGGKEGTPVVLMEAQACGKPCIATNHAGIPEVVINYKTGFIVEERDIKDIANKMIRLFKDDELRNKMGQNAIIHIKKQFNQNKQIDKLCEMYDALIKAEKNK